jgi:pimeloyl-ACP methyl ester carboxylesterase
MIAPSPRDTPSWLVVLTLLCGIALGQDVGPGFVRDHVRVEGAEISYVIRHRSGPTLVLVPGSLVGADDWSEVVAGLDPDLTIMIVELRGHGSSWPPAKNGTIPSFANDVLRATSHAGLGRFYVGGHSIGGMIAIEIGGRHPDLVKGILAIEGWTHYSVAKDALGGQKDTLSAAQLKRRDELRKPVLSRWTPEQVSDFTSVWRKWDGFDLLNQTPVPVLELWGDRRMEQRPSRAQMKIPDRPNIELRWVAGASHFLPLERPAEVAAAVNEFIKRGETCAPLAQH